MYSSAKQERRVPRYYAQSVDPDDCVQLQLLLQQEREHRQAAVIDRRLAEERRRLEEAMVRLQYIEEQRRQQRLEEERRLQREQRYRAELLAALKSTQEEEYRRRVLAALERQKQWETTRLQQEEAVQKQSGTAAPREDERRHQALENLLKHAFGHLEHDDEQHHHHHHHREAVPELAGDEGDAWVVYYRPEPRCLRPSSRKIPISFIDEPPQKQEPQKQLEQKQQKQQKSLILKEHVAPLKTVLETLLTRPTEQESQQKRQQESAEARHQRQQAKQEEARQQRLVEDRAFENFLNQVFGQQEQQPSTTPATAPPAPAPPAPAPPAPAPPAPAPAPKLSEDDAAAKIQTWYKSAHDSHAISQVTHQLGTLGEVSTQLDRIQSDYEKSTLAKPTASPTASPTPGVDKAVFATSQENRRWLQYEDEIMKMLVRLDTIESHGSELVRERRKQLVKKASALLDRLDEYKLTTLEHSSASILQSDDDDDDDGRPLTPEALPEPKPSVVPDLAAEEQPKDEDAQPKASEPAEPAAPAAPSVSHAVPGHPHPENPNATTVDDDEDTMDAQLEVSEPTLPEDELVEKPGEEEKAEKVTSEEGYVVV